MKRSRLSYPPADISFSPGLHRPAITLAVAFTPVMAGAGEQHFLQQPAPLSAQRTQAYTLGAGENAVSVAKKFHLTLDQLRELNQLRTFAHGLNGLQPGDDVDVSLMTGKDKKTASGTSTAPPPLLTVHSLLHGRAMSRCRRWQATPHRPEASWPAAQKVTRPPPWPGA